ncbi:bacillithiol biosynthesis cysteine-adding enzyme BshC [Flavobacterium sp. S87F.05.LMB.W.Kidney.N]|uniref:bacillithiol biosynthesis cysteine-adding enzyme BshC n=1 Tax=Flavobacterium sp. S87F.05.LMB.W.Kidney.N TaxID=1278758 RepID=UPI0010663C3D|nr:bacillithiol biosynthesis cysteine-adding enzyme BshC [Flavobacterium sp. S87F.05.LMB.W.Kidney.N]TDX12262.1 bacillithiol biosynthesis cysteine-adding enzyme BshC [Flavobacterium sp. S87F.05.LMB.W.Kidney.N]
MPTDCISFQSSGYFSKLMQDYLDQKTELKPLYNNFPTLENFEKQIAEKASNFDNNNRTALVDTLKKQYENIDISESTQHNITLLALENTFTITTGHQLNLFTGPLYFLYKIISTINLTKELKSKYPSYNFVPVYWMATEDHDFEEINYFNFKGKKIRWNAESTGPVGRLSTKGLEDLFEVYSKELGSSSNANTLKDLFEEAYLKHENLADATRFLANSLFSNYGLVIIDADNTDLKRVFIPYVKNELENQTSFKEVQKSIENLSDYTVQVNPREINLFYIEDKLRERIIFEDDKYWVNNTKISFSKEEILKLVDSNPEKFSPNVIMRPLYQEIILPNLCYIGGGGEIAYWLELKAFFDAVNITFPILLVRNSVLLATEKQAKKADNLNLSWKDLFSKSEVLINAITRKLSPFPIDLTEQKEALEKQFNYLFELAEKTDKSFSGAVKAQEVKQKKGLENLEKRLLKAQKRKLQDQLQRVTDLQCELFPNYSLQERQANFSEFYLENGEQLIPLLIQKLKPLENNFNIIIT